MIQETVDLLKSTRLKKGVTMQELSKRTGVSQKHISNIETHKAVPTLDTLIKLGNGLGIDIEIIVKYSA